MHELITTLLNPWRFLVVTGAALIGAQSVSAQTASDTMREQTTRSRVAIAHVLPHLNADHLQVKLVEVTYPPGGFSTPHTHPFPVIVYVIAGALRIQVKGEPEAIYKAGESFYEAPNGAHLVSANASEQEPAKFVACFVCDADQPLSLPLTQAQAEGGK
jgi:quercetin dioxygenase-like cupin family protein